jgi:hypothetical protein
MSQNPKTNQRRLLRRHNERGGATVFVVIFMLFTLVLATASVSNRWRESRARDASQVRLTESWSARAAAAVMDRVLKVRFPVKYSEDYNFAKNCVAAARADVKAFDEQDLNPNLSRPAAVINPDTGALSCADGSTGNGYAVASSNSASYTSLLGNLNGYLKTRSALVETLAGEEGFGSDVVQIASFQEAVRRFSSPGSEPAYQVHYVIDARGGRTGRFRSEGDIVIGSVMQTCGTTATLTADRTSVERGQQVTLTVNYSMATRLRIYELNTGTLINETTVTEQPNPQTYSFTFAPDLTNSYRVEASGTGNCSSQSAPLRVEVTAPRSNICATNPPRIPNFSASALEVNAGEEVVLQWATGGAIAAVTLNGTPVNQSENNYRVVITANTIFTLRVQDSDPDNDCPVEQQITIRVRTSNPCTAAAPTVNFDADRTSIQTGESVNLSWNVAGLDGSGGVSLTNADNSVQTVAAAGTTSRTFNQPGTYVFRLKGFNRCPDGSERPTEIVRTVIVSNNCPPPVISTAFAASPNTVLVGGNRTVRLSWGLSGTVDNISISPNIGIVTGNFIDISQPQTTTDYTLTVTGCGETRTATTRVTVTPVTPSPAFGCGYGGLGGVNLNHGFSSPFTGGVVTAAASIEPDGRLRVVACSSGGSFSGRVQTSVFVTHPAFGGFGGTWRSDTTGPDQYNNPVYFYVGQVDPALLEINHSSTLSGGSSGGSPYSFNCKSAGNTATFYPELNNNCTVNRR